MNSYRIHPCMRRNDWKTFQGAAIPRRLRRRFSPRNDNKMLLLRKEAKNQSMMENEKLVYVSGLLMVLFL